MIKLQNSNFETPDLEIKYNQNALIVDTSHSYDLNCRSTNESSNFGNSPAIIPCSVSFVDEDYVPSATNYPFLTCHTYVVLCPHKNKILFSKN